MIELEVSINACYHTEKPAKTGFNWGEFNDGFAPLRLSTFDLLEQVSQGNSFTAIFAGRRDASNFLRTQHIAVDIDDGSTTFDDLLKHEWVAAYACLVYPTLSSTPDSPRHRVVFALDEVITTADGYRAAIDAVSRLFPGYDSSCVDPARLMFGNGKIARDKAWDSVWYNDVALPLSVVRVEWGKQAKQRGAERREAMRGTQPTRAGGKVPPRAGNGGQQGRKDLTLSELMGRLRDIDPYSYAYGEWFQLGCAIAHVYGDAAMIPFLSWSNVPGKKRMGSKKWESMSAPHPNPSNYGTIVALLKQKGVAA